MDFGSPTSCSDINGSFNVKQGQHGSSVCKPTAGIETSDEYINGNNNRDIGSTKDQRQTMPDQDFQALNIEDNSNSQTVDSKESQNCDLNHHKSSAQTPSSPSTKQTTDSSTGAEDSHAAMSNCTSNSNEVEAETSSSSVVNCHNKSDIEKNNDNSVTETSKGEEAVEDIVIPVPTLPKSSPCADVKPKSSNGHAGPRFGQQKKRPPLARRPTPVKIETPAKLLNERMKMAKRENSFLEEEEEEG